MFIFGLIPLTFGFSGRWSQSKPLALSPTSAAQLSDGRILVWSANNPSSYTLYRKGQLYQIIEANGRVSPLFRSPLPTMFCTGISVLANGEILVNGGANDYGQFSALFNEKTQRFVATANMTIARGYNSNVMLTNDKIFTIGGSFNKPVGFRNGEVYDAADKTWETFGELKGDIIGGRGQGLSSVDPQGIYRSDNHAWLASWYNKTSRKHLVFHLGPTQDMYLMDVSSSPGSMFKYARRPTPYSINSANVMFSPGKYFAAGGAVAYGSNEFAGIEANPDAVIINLLPYVGNRFPTPHFRIIPMIHPRTFANAVVMPGGKIFVVGGQSKIHIFEDTDGVLAPEIFDPETGTFSLAPKMATSRNYHSFAMLMFDGRIMVGGGGLCVAAPAEGYGYRPAACPSSNRKNWIHNDYEIFTPSYILNANRPSIEVATESNSFLISRALNVRTECTRGCTFEMIKRSSVTHSTNNDQIRVPFISKPTGTRRVFRLTIDPSYQDWVTTGYYMLFVLQDGIYPSVSVEVYAKR